MRITLACALALVVVAVGSSQDRREARPVSKAVASDACKEFAQSFRNKDAKMRLAAVDLLVTKRHGSIAKCLAKALRDSSPDVRAYAAMALGKQACRDARTPLRRALLDGRNRASPKVLVAVLEAFVALKASPSLREMTKRFDQLPKEVQKGIVRALRWWRKSETVDFLARYIDVPNPKNVDSPTNPPASYWKKKRIAWEYWSDDLMDTLHHLTGEEFDDSGQIRAWRRKGGRIRKLQTTGKTGGRR